MIFLFLCCVSFHRIGKLKDFSSQEQREKQADQAAKWSARSFLWQKAQKQAFAAQVVGQLGVTRPAIIDQMLDTMQRSPYPSVRRQAYWSLGEMGRNLNWDVDAKRIHTALLQALQTCSSSLEAQLIVEAIIKNYLQHPHSTEENIQTLQTIHVFLSQTSNPPSSIFILKEQLQTLTVLCAVLQEQIDRGSDIEIYTSSLELLRFLATNRTQIYQIYPSQKSDIRQALSLSTQAMRASPPSQSMILWFLSTVANQPPLSSLLVEELVIWEQKLTPSARFVLKEALFQMLEEEAARHYFREIFLKKERSFSWWHESNHHNVDLVQQLYSIRVHSP